MKKRTRLQKYYWRLWAEKNCPAMYNWSYKKIFDKEKIFEEIELIVEGKISFNSKKEKP